MALGRKLFVNWHRQARQKSDSSASPDSVDRLTFRKYDVVPLEIIIVEPDPDGGLNDFVRVDITDLSLKVAINDTVDDATPLAEQTTWTKNTGTSTFSGNLSLNTALMNAYLSSDKTPYFEMEVTNSAGARVKILSELCNALVGVLQTTTTSPDPAQEFLTRQQQEGIFVKRILGPGESITFIDSNNVVLAVLGVREDGTFHADGI